jgi:hypothetical protein
MPSEQSITILYDHYKDTCSTIGSSIKRRDRLMIFVILTLAFFSLQALFPTASDLAVNDFLNFKFGLTSSLDFSVIGTLVWYLLLIFSMRYFQVAVFVERQYEYIHQIEERLNKEAEKELITREGKSYLDNYPAFSDWMWWLYTGVFPVLLLSIVIVKIIGETGTVCGNGWTFSLVLNTIAFAMIAISTVLYLIKIHRKPYKQNKT